MTTRKLFLTFALIGFVTMVGCSDKQQLTGTVTFSDDGSPLSSGVVYFSTPTFQAMGPIKPDGTYTVSSTGKDDGIPRGQTFAVTIIGADDVQTSRSPEGFTNERRTPLIDPKYTQAETSGLTFTASGNMRTFDIKVDRPPR